MNAVIFVFWSCIFLIFYAYIGYICLITVLSIFINRKVERKNIEPFVSLIITAYNEEKDIQKKLQNSIEIDYPAEKYEIIVASDASTDLTDSIVKRHENNKRNIKVVLHRVEGRKGKTAAQNSAVKISNGEIIIFSDAASLYDKGAIRAIVSNYADKTVGAVSGRYKYRNPQKASVGNGTILFWKLENFIKGRQTRIRTITGCCGCIYSVRKSLYTPLPNEIISDLVEPLTIIKKGYRIVFEENALATEETTENPADEFKMRVRVITRGMNGIKYVKSLLNIFKYPFVSLQLISHKILRWCIPLFCLITFFSNIIIAFVSPFYFFLLIAQCAFYMLALIGLILEPFGVKYKLFYLPMYFFIVNAASIASMYKFLMGRNIVVWETRR